MKYLRFLTLLLLAIPAAAPAQAILQLGTPTVSALVEANKADTLLGNLNTAASDALAGKKPAIPGDFKNLEAMYKKAAADLTAAPLQGTYTPPAPVSLAQINNCPTRAGALKTLQTDLTAMQASVADGNAAVTTLDQMQTSLAQSEKAVDFLKASWRDLLKVPIYGELFAIDWLELDQGVSASLSDLQSAVAAQRKKVAANLALLTPQVTSFQSNLALLNTLPKCNPLAGTWPAVADPASVNFGGTPYCSYKTTLQNVIFSITIAQDGRVTAANGAALMNEQLAAPCGNIHGGGPQQYQLRLRQGSTHLNQIHVDFLPVRPNAPVSTAQFDGTLQNGRLVGTFLWRRTDGGQKLNWQLSEHAH